MSRTLMIQAMVHSAALVILFVLTLLSYNQDMGYLPIICTAAMLIPFYGIIHVDQMVQAENRERLPEYPNR